MLQSDNITKYRFPFTPFPNSWFRVASSEELRPKDVKPLHYFGKNLVLFRTEEGKAQVFDAHCPHLGAHLGYGGKVKGRTIQCPFHGWCFDEEGQCSEIPYSSKIPPKAQIRSWPVRETNGMIWVYYHAQQKPPHWEIPEFPEYTSEQWTPLRFVGKWKIRTHPQELMENHIDFAHFPSVHSSVIRHTKVEDFKFEDSAFMILVFHKYHLPFAFHLPFKFYVARILGQELKGPEEFSCYGLGCSAIRIVFNPIKHYCFFMITYTTIDEEYTEYTMFESRKKNITGLLTNFNLTNFDLKEIRKTVEQDLPIWENKVYHNNPLLSEDDGPIAQYRRWASQFYSGHLKNSDFITEKPKSKNSTAGIEENKDSIPKISG